MSSDTNRSHNELQSQPEDPSASSASAPQPERQDSGLLGPCPGSPAAADDLGTRHVEFRLAEATKATARGWALTPLKGKVPLLKGWQSAASPSLDAVKAWARRGNVGLRTGAASGVVVIDDDSVDGSAGHKLALPPTVTVITGAGKRHFYFRAPGFPVRNSVRALGPEIDLRGDGGQVVFVGSIHPDTGKPYRWASGLTPEETELAELPTPIIAQLRAPDAPCDDISSADSVNANVGTTPPQRAQLRPYTSAALRSASASIRTAPKGSRNDRLYREAFGLGQLVAAGVLNAPEATETLADAARAAGLGDDETRRTVQSGLERGQEHPRSLPSSPASRTDSTLAAAGDRPVIRVDPGSLPHVVDAAEEVLRSQNPPRFYQRGTSLVRLFQIPVAGRWSAGTDTRPVIREVDIPYLVDRLTAVASWEKFDARSRAYVTIDCPDKVARTILSRVGRWRFPHLLGVINTPTLRSDGSVLEQVGYDSRTKLYLAPSDTKFPRVALRPTRDSALDALEHLLEPIGRFPWLEEADRSVALAAILTALIRPSLRTAPLFAFRAPKMGSGKSLLADTVALIAAGRPAAVMTQGQDENEDRKRILAILLENEPVACIDNIEQPFGSAALCSVLTSQTWRDRILGKSQTAIVPTTNTTWLATGNNIQFVGDITTRVLACDLDPRCERPEERKFDVNLHKHIPENRGALVSAGLTILRAYRVAGRPNQSLPVFGRFEEWSDWIRSTVVWLGLPDPCLTRARLSDADPVRQQLLALLPALKAEFSDKGFAATDALTAPRIRGVLVSLTGDAQPQAQQVGHLFHRYLRRQEGGLRLVRAGERRGSAIWRVENVQ